MASRGSSVLLVALFMFAPAFAGCLAGDDAGGGDPLTNESAGNETPPEDLPGGREGEFAAFKETNQTENGTGGMAHDHDYWQGRSRVRLFEAHAEMNPSQNEDGTVEGVFRPPLPALVYEGTAKVVVEITNPVRRACEPAVTFGGKFVCTDNLDYHTGAPGAPAAPDPNPPPMELQFLHGASNPGEFESAGPIEWGVPLEIQVKDPTWTDMPHSTASLWTFKFVSSDASATTLEFDVAVDLVRAEGQEIPQWPGHPDFYADTCCRKILDAAGSFGYGAGFEAEPEYEINKLISHGTRTLYVWANITGVQGGPVEPTHVYLFFHNASARNWNLTAPYDENHTSDKTEHHWILRVDDNAMDTPYATQSRWEFQVRGSHSVTTPANRLACYHGCASYTLDYNLAIIATNEELPPDMYDRPIPGGSR